MRHFLAASLILALVPGPAWACLNDRDSDEASGSRRPAPLAGVRQHPDVMAAISGRFERNPPLYYQMRLVRVAREVASAPGRLGLYDDAAVACDRLGRFDEAIEWMAKKRAVMEATSLPAAPGNDAWYRYHANLGTHLVHRWLKGGADRGRLDELVAGRDHIARALEINPYAHSGREPVQLRVMNWLLDPPEVRDGRPLPSFVDDTKPVESPTAEVEGLAGLITLGAAWESVDVFHALSIALARSGFPDMSSLARSRAEELIDGGKRSILPGSPTGPSLKGMLAPLMGTIGTPGYKAMRKAADEWHRRRTEYLMARLEKGQHPDTDPDFWQAYQETPDFELDAWHAEKQGWTEMPRWMVWEALAGAALLIAVASVLIARRLAIRNRRHASEWVFPDEPKPPAHPLD